MAHEDNSKNEPLKKNWYDNYYKKLLIIPIILVVLSLAYIGYFYSVNNDFIYRDISLTGGTTVTINDPLLDSAQMELDLATELVELNTRDVYDLITREQRAVVIGTITEGQQTKEILENYLGYELTNENSSFEFTGSALSEAFFKQLLLAIIIAFSFMGWVVFVIFGKSTKFKIITGVVVFLNAFLSFGALSINISLISSVIVLVATFIVYLFYSIPSTAVILSAFVDILMTLAVVNMFGIKMSSAGIVAFLMLIGYSVDTDILLTNKVLKRREGSINERILGAFKTGTTMTLTSLLAMIIALLVVMSFSIVLTQIFTILVIGLGFDLLNTWITNASILKWYAEHKER